MVRLRDPEMGRFSVEVDLTNNDDLVLHRAGALPADRIRRVRLSGVVDSGSARLVLPESVAMQLGLRPVGETTVRYANQSTAQRPMYGDVLLTYAGRSGLFQVVGEPARVSALIGAP